MTLISHNLLELIHSSSRSVTNIEKFSIEYRTTLLSFSFSIHWKVLVHTYFIWALWKFPNGLSPLNIGTKCTICTIESYNSIDCFSFTVYECDRIKFNKEEKLQNSINSNQPQHKKAHATGPMNIWCHATCNWNLTMHSQHCILRFRLHSINCNKHSLHLFLALCMLFLSTYSI